MSDNNNEDLWYVQKVESLCGTHHMVLGIKHIFILDVTGSLALKYIV